MNIYYLLMIFSLSFLLKEISGPWGILSWIRNKLIDNKYVGVFFYNLFSCWYCVGSHSGYLIYFITQPQPWTAILIIQWCLTGAICSLMLGILLEKIQRD